MPELPHLPLIQLTSDLPRLKRRGYSDLVPRGPNERERFGKKAHEDCDAIFAEFKQLQEEYKGSIDPELIFRIDLKALVKPSEIERMGLKLLFILDKNAIIVFSSKRHFDDFFAKLDEYVVDSTPRKHPFLDAFIDLEKIVPKTKIGPHLDNVPLGKDEKASLDVEFWFLGDDAGSVRQMDKWASKLKNIIIDNGGEWIGKLRTKSFYVMRVKLSQALTDKIIKLPQVASIDRPSRTKLSIRHIKEQSLDELEVLEPSQEATGVLVIDSGIVSGHPLLSKAIGEAKSFISGKSPVDQCGHGTSVAGLSLYGDIIQCIKDKRFDPDCWLFSARVLDENGSYSDQKLMETQFLKSLNLFIKHYPIIKVINISIGNTDDILGSGKHQFRWASLIDEKLYELSRINRDLVIVVSAGNNFAEHEYQNYPENLFNDDSKLINPATSALAITVGSISPGLESNYPSRHPIAGHLGFPSPFTRTGPGLGGMMKPELVDIGGDLVYPADYDPSIGVVTTNNEFIREGLFVIDNGTSLSSAKVSNLIAKLWNIFPSASANLIKALLISSCQMPRRFQPDRSGQIPLDLFCSPCYPTTIDSDEKINSTYGYGFPNIKQAKSSDINKVILLDDSTIKLDSAKFYEIPLPESYYSTNGDRELSIALCFDPQTKITRGDSYLGCTMEFRLHRGSSLDELKAKYTKLEDVEFDEVTDPKEISLSPGPRARSKGCTQKGSTVLKRPSYSDESLQLAVICRDKWIGDLGYEQKYAIVARVAHEYPIDIYNPIKLRIESKIRARARI
jgi:hypothetical protein